MTKEEITKAVEELRLILGNLKGLKPEELRQHTFAHNYGSAETKAFQMVSLAKEAERQLLNLEKSLPQTNKDFE
jgi:hypothetical protein